MLNPFITKIKGDLSKADIVILVQTCRNKHVVEYGVGASTILISQVAKSLISFDTDQNWINITKNNLKNIDKMCEPKFILISKEETILPKYECDVLFDDGHSCLRSEFLKQYWLEHIKEKAILHDARTNYAVNIIKNMLSWYDIENYIKERDIWVLNPYLGSLISIEWCPMESNMVILNKRSYILKYENWNITEKKEEIKNNEN